MERRLYRDEQHKTIGGVCAGLSDYLHMDVSIIRVLFLLSFILKGFGFILYIILWIVLPKKPYGYGAMSPGVDYVADPEGPVHQPAGVYPAQKSSTGRVIGGMVLLMIGLLLLLNEFDIIPDFDFEYFWPSLLIVVGLIFIFTSRHKSPVISKEDPFNEPPQL